MSDDLRLWYDRPAANWLAALPVGNGRVGAMVYGRVHKEFIALNEETLWTGRSNDRRNPAAREHLDEVRGLLMSGDVRRAHFVTEAALFGTPPNQAAYQFLSNLVLLFADQYDEQAQDYRRTLDLTEGIAVVEFSLGATRFRREIFASAVTNTLVVRLTVRPGRRPDVLRRLLAKVRPRPGEPDRRHGRSGDRRQVRAVRGSVPRTGASRPGRRQCAAGRRPPRDRGRPVGNTDLQLCRRLPP